MHKEQEIAKTRWLTEQHEERQLAYEQAKQAVKLRVEEIGATDQRQRADLRKLLKLIKFRTRMRGIEFEQTARRSRHSRRHKHPARAACVWRPVRNRQPTNGRHSMRACSPERSVRSVQVGILILVRARIST